VKESETSAQIDTGEGGCDIQLNPFHIFTLGYGKVNLIFLPCSVSFTKISLSFTSSEKYFVYSKP
jgi:hypothetical protein